MMLFPILVAWLLYAIEVQSQLNLHNIDRYANVDALEFDCLSLSEQKREIVIEYCRRPTDVRRWKGNGFANMRDENYTFQDLHQMNVSSEELLLWSVPIDLVEHYQYFLDEVDVSLSTELIFNCTPLWFGSQCQYAFPIQDAPVTIQQILNLMFDGRKPLGRREDITNGTCYVHLQCDRGGLAMCLDWREICDGRIDCSNGGIDESDCADLEMNECDENQFRCHYGMCIAKEFRNSPNFEAFECLDTSDVSARVDEDDFRDCFRDATILCEERMCRPGSKAFACGDGQCVEDFHSCNNGRHLLLMESMAEQGDLSYHCWRIMLCLTKVRNTTDEEACEGLSYLDACDSLIQFPTISVLYGHVTFLYLRNMSQSSKTTSILEPHYICYDEILCDFLRPSFRHGTYSCQHGYQMGFNGIMSHPTWSSMVNSLKGYFQGCSIPRMIEGEHPKSNMYCCKNSSKCISKHRIVDGIADCYLNDDEEAFHLSCSLNDSTRFKCYGEEICRSPFIPLDICPSSQQIKSFDQLAFKDICNRFVDISTVMINGQNHTDETDCGEWPCNNIYTQCDLLWHCPKGEDEENCFSNRCTLNSMACISPQNYQVTCLPMDRVGNNQPDCAGGFDESNTCPAVHSNREGLHWYRCFNETKCLMSSQLCNGQKDCQFGDDEDLCENVYRFCIQPGVIIGAESFFCLIRFFKKFQFRLSNTFNAIYLNYSVALKRSSVLISNDLSLSNSIDQVFPRQFVWKCNRGLYLHHWLGDEKYNYSCLCPPSYYGDLCQYQNQRITVVLRLKMIDRYGVYTILTVLIDDDNQEIHSYHQLVFFFDASLSNTCSKKLGFYLLYPERPKNPLQNFSVRFDVFDTIHLQYLGSWNLPIPFSFLPVHRLATTLLLPASQIPPPNDCPLLCVNGKCHKYINREKYFCRCDPGWTDLQCDTAIEKHDCSADSILFGPLQNQSICVCPLSKFGRRCLLRHACPTDFCRNNGRCVVRQDITTELKYACICSEEFAGADCSIPKKALRILFNNIELANHMTVHILTVHSFTSPASQILLKKLSAFDQHVTFYSDSIMNMVFVKMDTRYYLAGLDEREQSTISTSITSDRRCLPVRELMNSTFISLPRIQQVKQYHQLCKRNRYLKCFFDKILMCLCTVEHLANCFEFNYDTNLRCDQNLHCRNGGTCLQDNPTCPSTTICVCSDCYFGNQCQFYSKGIGLTLEDILLYEMHPSVQFKDQSLTVHIITALTMVMFLAGLLNSTLTYLTFYRANSRKVGCGMYLLASSMTSLLTIVLFTAKFWFLLITQIDQSIDRSILQSGCLFLEPTLKFASYFDSWLNACVAIERVITMWKGIHFDQAKSQMIARWIIRSLPLVIALSIIHEPLHRHLFDDYEAKRIWCVISYSHLIQIYDTVVLFFHFLVPFLCNLSSALGIIFMAAHRRATVLQKQSYAKQLYEELRRHAHILISPLLLVILSLPRLIISLLPQCLKAYEHPWLYLLGYFISFVPSVTVFAVFVLPSDRYRNQCKQTVNTLNQMIQRRRTFFNLFVHRTREMSESIRPTIIIE